ARIGLSDGPHHGDGLLALCGLVRLLLGLLLSRWRASDRGIRRWPQSDSAAVPASGAVDHLPPGLAAGMVRDHHHLRADLPAALAAVRDRPAVLRHPGGPQ